MQNEITRSARDELPWVEKTESVGLVQSPRQQDGRGDFIELFAVPVGLAVDPTILRNGAIVILQAGEPNQRTKRGAGLARGEQRRGAFDHITRPHQMISTQIRI